MPSVHFHANAHPGRPLHLRPLVAAILAALVAVLLAPPAVASGHELRGSVFQDANRDGVVDVDEVGWSGMVLYLMSGDRSTYLGNTRTAADGTYRFSGVAPGSYVVEPKPSDWWGLRDDWVPTTTGSLLPRLAVTVDGDTTADLGLREIVRSTTPITSMTGPSGVRVHSHNDVVTADEVHGVLTSGSLLGDEAPLTVVTHDRPDAGTSCTTSTVVRDGQHEDFRASCNIAWSSWVTGADRSLFHEYGHAWSLYHALVVQQDSELTGYLEVRGLLDDPRLESSHAWSRREMIAEDYRQLFGSEAARGVGQENRDVPPATEVAGLEDYLRDVFMTAPAGGTVGDEDPPAEPQEPEAPEEPAEEPSVDATILAPTSGEAVQDTVVVEASAVVTAGVRDEVTVRVRLGDGAWVDADWDAQRDRYVASMSTRGTNGAVEVTARAVHTSGAVDEDRVVVEVVKGKGGGGGSGDSGETRTKPGGGPRK